MSYRKLIALTVFGAAVFLQGCEDDDDAPRIECSASNIDFSADADPKFATPTPGEDELFTVINDEIDVADSKLVTQATNCVACLLDEGATYQAAAYQGTADTDDLDATNFETKLNCWQTNAAMKDCGATTDLPACTGSPCADLAEPSVDKAVGDCALCLDQQDTSDATKLATAFTTCGLAFNSAVFGGCATQQVDVDTAANIKYAALETLLKTTGDSDPYDNENCKACIDEILSIAPDADVTGCTAVNTAYVAVCGGTFETAQTCEAN